MAGDDDTYNDVGNPAGFIKGLISAGENQSNGYDIFHEAGGHMQESLFNALYKTTFNAYADQPEALAQDPFSVPAPSDYDTWELRRGSGFATQVAITVYDKGIGDFLTMQSTYITDYAHTPQEAQDAMIAEYDPENTGTNESQVMMGAIATNFWQIVPIGGV